MRRRHDDYSDISNIRRKKPRVVEPGTETDDEPPRYVPPTATPRTGPRRGSPSTEPRANQNPTGPEWDPFSWYSTDGNPPTAPRPAKIHRQATVDKDGTTTCTDTQEESTLEHNLQSRIAQNNFALSMKKLENEDAKDKRIADLEMHNRVLFQKNAELQVQLNKIRAELASKGIEIEGQLASKQMEINSQLDKQEMAQHHDLTKLRITTAAEAAKAKQEADIRKASIASEVQMKQNQHMHDERMVALNNIGEIAKANEMVANGRLNRTMVRNDYKDNRNMKAWTTEQTWRVEAADNARKTFRDICAKFGAPEVDANRDAPRIIKAVLPASDIYYDHSLLITGVAKLCLEDEFNPHVIFKNGIRRKLPGAYDGYSYEPWKQLAATVYEVTVKYYGPDHFRRDHPWAWYKNKTCLKHTPGCEVV